MKTNLLFISIILLGILLRLFYLSKIPNGFYSDELAFAYNSYSLLTTAKDEFGTFLPLVLKSFGDYKAALFAYFLAPFIYLGGLTVFVVRFGSAFLGILQIILVFLITKELLKSKKLALLSSFLIAISPFALQFNRMAHENNLSITLISASLYLFIKLNKSLIYFPFAIIFSVLSLYAYHDARVIAPLLIILMMIFKSKFLFQKKIITFICLASALILLFPLAQVMQKKETWTRMINTSLFTDYGMVLTVNVERGESGNNHLSKFWHNKLTVYSRQFVENYFSHFDLKYLLFHGDPVQIYQTVGNGILLFIEFPFLILGLFYIFNYRNNRWLVILSWLIIAPLAGALTRYIPSASRTFFSVIPLNIIIAGGIIYIASTYSKKYFTALLISILFLTNFSYYLHYYYFNTPVRYAKEWHYGMEEVINKVALRQKNYQTVWFSNKAWGYLYPLFFLKFPPAVFQSQAKLGPLDQYGFGWVNSFDKYIFDRIPKYYDENQKILYIASPEDLNFNSHQLDKIAYPNGMPAFFIFDGSEAIRSCQKECDLKYKPQTLDIFGDSIEKL